MPMPTESTVAFGPEAPLAPKDATTYKAWCQAQEGRAKALFAKLSGPGASRSDATLLRDIDGFARAVDQVMSSAALMRSVHPDAGIREVASQSEQAISQLVTDVNLSRPLYEAVQAVDLASLDADTKRLVHHLLRDFRRAGVDKSEQDREDIRRLKDELVVLGQHFDRNIREDTRSVELAADTLEGLPADYIAAHPANDKGRVTITTDYPDYIPFMTYAHSDTARKQLYLIFRQRGAPKNEDVLQSIVNKRHELAVKLGYTSWADYITEDKMIGGAQAAQQFVDKVSELSIARSHEDLRQLAFVRDSMAAKQDAAQSTPPAVNKTRASAPVEDWQKAYLEEQERRLRYQLDAQAVRAFFPFSRVRDGILTTMAHMFDVSFRRVTKPVWHDEVEAYELLEHGQVKGIFYLDLHPRPDKYKHAAAFAIRAGTRDGNEVVLPEAALVCNFPGSQADAQALMEHDEVTTFFHEFGHLLHHLFASERRWVGQSGIATEWDFVEAPSQMLEEWSFDKETLQRFAIRQDGQVLGDDTIDSMRRARALGRGLWVRQQMFYAALSLAFHRLPPGDPLLKSTDVLTRDIQKRYAPLPPVEGSHFQLSFGHLEGYSAMYYTYMWSLVIAKDLFSEFQGAKSLSDPAVARRYRDSVLAPGGSKDASELVRDFLQRDFRFEAFAQWVNAAD